MVGTSADGFMIRLAVFGKGSSGKTQNPRNSWLGKLAGVTSWMFSLFGGWKHVTCRGDACKNVNTVEILTCFSHQNSPRSQSHGWRFKEDDFQPIYHCAHCNQRRFASKRTWLWSLPPVLPVQLKRFHCETSTGTFQKLGDAEAGGWCGVGPLDLVPQPNSRSER